MALRATLRAARDASPQNVTVRPSAAFIDRLHPVIVVATYIPIGSEADPLAYTQAARAAGCIIALPHVVDRATPLVFRRWPSGELPLPGPYGLSNPQPDWPAATPDIILTPLLAFDRRGHRLGQGAGHYDRAFAAFPAAWRVGIAFAMQEIDAVPTDPWDQPLHAITTEREWIVPA